jgi:Tfp pilus assembly protein PilF
MSNGQAARTLRTPIMVEAFSRCGLAMECMNSGDPAAAHQHFRGLLTSNASYVPAYLMYAQMLARESRAEEARQVLSTGIAAAEKSGDQPDRKWKDYSTNCPELCQD